MTASPLDSPESPQLRELLSAITAYSNDVTFASEPGEREGPALSLLKIAMTATMELERVFENTREFPLAFGDVAEFFRDVAPHIYFWPVPFNEAMDLEPYRKLRIGHDLINSQAPNKRTGRTPFAYYAQILVQRIEFFRQECQSGEAKAAHEAQKRRTEQLVSFVERLSGANASVPWLALHKFQPAWLDELGQLPEFSKASESSWTDAAKRFFKEAIPAPEQIQDLAKAINDKEVTYESQLRARIVERVGRAVKALAPSLGISRGGWCHK